MDDCDIAMDFLQGLSMSKYGEFIAEILNDTSKDPSKKPKDLNHVYTLANTRVVFT